MTTNSTYANSGDYTYPIGVERALVQSVNWPGDVNAQLLAQQEKNVRLEECNAWLEGELADQRQEINGMKAKIAAQGRQLGRIVRMVEALNVG